MNKIILRTIRPDEAEQAAEIERICFPPNEACSREMMVQRVAKAPELFLVAEDTDTGLLVGFLNGLSTTESKFRDEFFTNADLYDPQGDHVMLLGLDVLPDYRLQGIASRLMAEYAAKESDNGRSSLLLTCLESRVSMYEKMGFQDLGTADSSWGGETWHEMVMPLQPTIIRPAEPDEYEAVRDFYYELIDKVADFEYHPMWQKGIYPEDIYLEDSIYRGELYITTVGPKIIGAMIVNHSTNDGYESVKWTVDAAPDEITVIHALGVMPDNMRSGIATMMVEEVQRMAAESGQKAIRLDVLRGNLPAEKLYLKTGFRHITSVNMYYEDTGWTDFGIFEYVI